MRQEVLRLERITKMQDGVTVLDNFNLHIFVGEIMGLVFVDTHGKTELVNLICANTPVHFGMVYFREILVNSYQYSSMSANGVTRIEKKSRLVDDMTVADNVFVLRSGFKKYILNPQVLNVQFAAFAREAGVEIDGGDLVGNLSAYQKCVVQLLKAVMAGHRLIIVQEISNIVSAIDLKKFHGLLRHFSKQGIAVLYICNHHEEIFSICDRAAVVENGQVLRNIERSNFSAHVFQQYLLDVGYYRKPDKKQRDAGGVLHFAAVSSGILRGLEFSVAKGECVALLDISNTALPDIFELLNRQKKPASGRVLVDGKNLHKIHGKRDNLVGVIQESPTKSMLFSNLSYMDNLCFWAGEKKVNLWLNRRLRRSVRQEYFPLLGEEIDAFSLQGLSAFSLYNLVYYGQNLYHPRLLVIMQPFLGADMYLRRHILALIDQIRSRGTAVLMLSVNISDSPVVADRMLVMENGAITHEYHREDMALLNQRKELLTQNV